MAELKSPVFRGLPKKAHHKELRLAVCKAIDEMEPGTKFSSVHLFELVVENYPGANEKFLETILRYARMYRRTKFICVDRYNSIYERVNEEE